MDYTIEEGPSIPVLGEPDPGNAWGAVHGWWGDLWCRGIRTLPSKLTINKQSHLLQVAATSDVS